MKQPQTISPARETSLSGDSVSDARLVARGVLKPSHMKEDKKYKRLICVAKLTVQELRIINSERPLFYDPAEIKRIGTRLLKALEPFGGLKSEVEQIKLTQERIRDLELELKVFRAEFNRLKSEASK